MAKELAGTRVLLTGATGGLGRAIAERMRTEGAELILSARRGPRLDELAAQLGVRRIPADLADPAAAVALVKEAGMIDVLIANAAVPAGGPISGLDSEQLRIGLAVNLAAPIAMAHAVLPQMTGRRRGHIVFIGSVSGLVASPNSGLYCATKFGLRGFAAALRQELGSRNVGVSMVMPGFVREAGMACDGGLIGRLPRWARTVSPQQVARAVVDAVRRNEGEKVVAPVEMRILAAVGGISPRIAASGQQLVRRSMGAPVSTQDLGGEESIP